MTVTVTGTDQTNPHEETEGQASFGEYNPALVHSLVDVGSRNLDALSLHPGGAGEEVEFVPRDGDQDSTIAVSNADRGKFFTLLATDEDAYTELSRNVGAHQQTNLNHAINNDGDTAEAGAYNSRLDGYLQAGYVNAAMTSNQADYDEAMEGYQETRRALEMGQNLVTGAVTASHPAGFAAAAPTNALLDEIIDSSLDKPELETYDTSGLENTEYSEARAGYAYLAASHQADPDSLTERDREILIDEDGDLRSFQEIRPGDYQQLATERDHTNDDVPAAERGRNEYVMNNQTANTFAEVDGSDDIQGYLDGKNPAPTPGDGDDDDG